MAFLEYDTLACCWDVKQPTNKHHHCGNGYVWSVLRGNTIKDGISDDDDNYGMTQTTTTKDDHHA